jgi:polysaccharide pyruvyl transferase CsaB
MIGSAPVQSGPQSRVTNLSERAEGEPADTFLRFDERRASGPGRFGGAIERKGHMQSPEAERRLHARDRVLRVGISGSYGGLNLGDEAILESIVTQLRDSFPAEITVFSRDPDDTLARHDVERAVHARSLTRREVRAEVERLDLFILGGGGILYDHEATTYLREVFLAHELGIPVVVYAISAGPLDDPRARKAVREALEPAALVTVRDRPARKLLEDVGLEKDILVTADPAFLLNPMPVSDDILKREGLDGKKLVGFSVREPGPAAPDIDVNHYQALLANAADFMVDRLDVDIVFVPMERLKMDLQQSHAVVSRMQCAQRATVLRGAYTSGEVLSLMSRFEFAVGMRLHFLIFAALQGVPFVALPYASKVLGLVQDLDLEMPPLKDVTTGRLIANIDRSWDTQGRIRQRLSEAVPEMKERARETNRLVARMLGAPLPLEI